MPDELSNIPPCNAGVRAIEWDEHGMPVPVFKPIMTNQQIAAVNRAQLSTRYVPKTNSNGELLPGEEKHLNKTKLEVASEHRVNKAAYGDDDAYERILDRTLGKPKQVTENVNVNITLQQGLDLIADAIETKEGKPIDVEVIPQNRLEDLW